MIKDYTFSLSQIIYATFLTIGLIISVAGVYGSYKEKFNVMETRVTEDRVAITKLNDSIQALNASIIALQAEINAERRFHESLRK